MSDPGDSYADEARPIAATPSQSGPPREMVDPGSNSGTRSEPTIGSFPGLPAVLPPSAPVAATPAGWYAVAGGQRYWDGWKWTEHYTPAAVPSFQHGYQVPAVTTDARTNGVEVALAWILAVLTLGYLLPWAVAATRGKSNSWAVGLVNLLLGWTFIGWVAALVMACMPHQVVVVHHRV